MDKKLLTPSQTIGPFFAYGLLPEQYGYDFDSWVNGDMAEDILTDHTITIVGKVFDGEANAIPDAVIEIWQNDGENKRFGRFGTGTDRDHRFIFRTTKPRPVEGGAPFLSVIVFMRGQLIHSYTRIYFSDDKELNEKDEVLSAVPQERRHTLIAQKKGRVYEFNIHMQGEKETVFFEINARIK